MIVILSLIPQRVLKIEKNGTSVVPAGPPGRELLRATGESLGGAGAAQEGLPQDEHHPLAHLMRHQ